MTRSTILFLALLIASGTVSGETVTTLAEAIAAALEHSPRLAAHEQAVHAADARAVQAGLLPNPEIEIEVEEFGGSGDLRGFDGAEASFVVSQPFELGGKRRSRRAAAGGLRGLATSDLNLSRVDVVADTSADFHRALAAKGRVFLADESVALAERLADTIARRVEAGKVSPIEQSRTRVPLAAARIELMRNQAEVEIARARLATNWGGDAARIGEIQGRLDETQPVPSLATLLAQSDSSPLVARWDEEIRLHELEVQVERSLRIPDLTLSAGPVHLREIDETAWIAGVSLGVPLFDRNQGSIAAADHELERARLERSAAETTLRAQIVAAQEHLAAALAEVQILAGESEPAAAEAFSAVEIGYREGKLGLLDLLDAQQTLFDTRSHLLDAREAYHLARIELDRLVGQPMGR